MTRPDTNGQVLVLGAGVAGLAAALALRPMPVTVITPGPVRAGGSTAWAQGGIAAAVDPADSPRRHAADTEAAGAGLCDSEVVAAVAAAAPDAIRWLETLGVRFDRTPDGARARALEGGHGRARVLHAGGDRSGAAIRDALLAAAAASPSIAFAPGCVPTALLRDGTGVAGVRVRRRRGAEDLHGRAVVLATGGYAGLFAGTTNPLGNWGGGLALAARAGATLRDLEMVQFHPTAMALDADPLPLASEAIRGAGARLVDETGAPVMAAEPGGDLAPRDRVAAAVFRRRAAGDAVFLDTPGSLGARFADHFPSVAEQARAHGLDPASRAIPVRPAAHYTMGGVRADVSGRTTLPGLWACGEVAATGLHGANRLASNSMLEGVVMARWLAEDIAGISAPARPGRAAPAAADAETGMAVRAAPADVRRILAADVGVVRDRAGLIRAIHRLSARRRRAGAPAEVALMVAVAALRRAESRGAHQRSEAPRPASVHAQAHCLTRTDVLNAAAALAGSGTREAA